jgi:ketosteroid isomerase-like protein
MTAVDITLLFVEKINQHDPEGLGALMTEDHLFIDSEGNQVQGKEKMLSAWQGYFSMMPDYHIKVEKIFENQDEVVLLGIANGTYAVEGKLLKENQWEILAAWRAVVQKGLVSEWQVYADNSGVGKIIERNKK